MKNETAAVQLPETKKPAKNFREFERENEDVKKAEHLKLPLGRITIQKGYNPRDLNKPATQEKIANIQAAYEKGEFVPLPVVRMALDGNSAEIVDGECRYTAAVRADKAMKARGEKGIAEYEVIRFTGTEVQARNLTFKANLGEQLTPMEQADHVLWYRAQNLTRDQIAEELGKGVSWIDRLISFGKLPKEIQDLVRADKLNADEAVKYVKKFGDKAYEEIMAKLEGKGGAKVTAKDAATPGEGGDGNEEGEGTDPEVAAAEAKRKAEEKAAQKAEQKRAAAQYETAKKLAFALPDKIKKPRTIDDNAMYPVELSGASIKLLLALQDRFDKEIEADFKAQQAERQGQLKV